MTGSSTRHLEPKTIREQSGLPAKFTDAECAAYVWLHNCNIRGWAVDLAYKSVINARGDKYSSLIEYAERFGWEGMVQM